jgi:hypothetical protein
VIRTWCIAPEQDSDFVAHMEQVLDTYLTAYDPTHPVVCFDECSKELRGHLVAPIVDETGTRVDTDYVRNGLAPMHIWIEPLTGRMGAMVSERRTKTAFARAMRELLAGYPDAEQVTVVLDNLNTHRIGAFYQTFPPEEARRLIKRIRFVHTPRHGSWLNMAEVAISVLSRAVLHKQRLPNRAELEAVVTAWVTRHNRTPHPFTWQWDIDRARARMPRVYPIIDHDK